MADSVGLTDFFAMEAADYLERMDGLVSKATFDVEEFLRVSRALRGSALMANQQIIAASAAGFEQVAKAIREGRRQWDARTKQAVVRAVDDFKVIVRRLRDWTAADDEKVRAIGASLEEAAGAVPTAAKPSAPRAADLRARTLIAQQGATLAAALEAAAGSVGADPTAVAALNAVLQVTQPLRGIASLADYPPLPDILDALERTIGEVQRQPRAPDQLATALRAAAAAVSRAAREIAAGGSADPEAPELAHLVNQLGVVLGLDRSVIPIEALFYDDAGPHTVEPGIAPVTPTPPGGPQLVPHGEYLQQAADGIERARSAAERELRAQGLLGTFRALAAGGDGPLAEAAAAFGRAGRDALAYGCAGEQTAEFVAHLRRAGSALAQAGRLADPKIAAELNAVTAALRQAVSTAVAVAPSPAVVPIEQLAPAVEPAAAVSAAPPATDGEPPNLAGSYRRFERLVAAFGLDNPSVDSLLAGPPALPVAAAEPPAPARRPTPAAPPRPPVPTPAEGHVAPTTPAAAPAAGGPEVPIETLLYDGPAALERALALRSEVRRALEAGAPDTEAIRELLEEVFDLVQLGQLRGR
ncbi:MAG TPA: hypothetical protein VNL18_12590 [Gemmatimonadales bacterium]|nr:hypothetical protein [Gemmatimonadales bacterium]